MKKTILVGTLILVVLLTLGMTAVALAQTPTPNTPGTPYGRGMMGGRWGGSYGMMGARGGRGMMGFSGYGPMHEYMEKALAEALGLSEEDVETRLAAGETPYQIAQSKGLSDEEITTLMATVHETALKAAVEAGALTQQQADWMLQRMQGRWQNGGQGFGPCHGGAAPNGSGFGPGWRTAPQATPAPVN